MELREEDKMQVHQDAFIGIVDILGYNRVENKLSSLGKEPSAALLANVFQFLDMYTVSRSPDDGVTWIRYGDGYVCFADRADITNLTLMVEQCTALLALALNQSIPLRVALTQQTLNVDASPDGTTISGPGWDLLRTLEPSLDWMGGLLHLPGFDGRHCDTVRGLVQRRQLVIAQATAPTKFDPPFKQKPYPANSWFLNWEEVLKRPKPDLDRSVEEWWSQFVPGGLVDAGEDVTKKKTNTRAFADYCRKLRHAAQLIYHSETHTGVHV